MKKLMIDKIIIIPVILPLSEEAIKSLRLVGFNLKIKQIKTKQKMHFEECSVLKYCLLPGT